jgi:hypothetical protein
MNRTIRFLACNAAAWLGLRALAGMSATVADSPAMFPNGLVLPAAAGSMLFLLCGEGRSEASPSPRPSFALGVEYMSPGLAEIYARTGVRWAKAMGAGFAWGDVEPKPPVNGKHTYDWHNTDRLLLEYQRAGFRHFQLYTKARCGWATSKPLPPLSHGSFPPKAEFSQDYADYLRNLVERYDKDGDEDAPGLLYPVLYYEIEAEWGTFWLGTTEEYLELLKVAHAAVKSAHPQAQVILIGFFLAGVFEGNPDPDIERAIREHLPPHQQAKVRRGIAEADKLLSHPELFDVVEFHSLSDWTEIVGMTRFLREKMRQHGYEKPIWVGDVNYTASPMLFWGVPVPPYTRAQKPAIEETLRLLANPRHPRHAQVEAWFRAEQACGLVKKAVLAMGEGCAGINLGNLEDWDIFAFVPTITGTAAFHGLVERKGWVGRAKADADRIPGEARPAYHALALVSQKLSDFTAVKTLSLGKGVYAYTFTVNSREVTVLWYDDGKRYLPGEVPPSRRIELPAPPQPHRLLLTPTERQVPAPPARRLVPVQGKLTMELGATPVFLEASDGGLKETTP